jgi:hypothetical protein
MSAFALSVDEVVVCGGANKYVYIISNCNSFPCGAVSCAV